MCGGNLCVVLMNLPIHKMLEKKINLVKYKKLVAVLREKRVGKYWTVQHRIRSKLRRGEYHGQGN